MDGWGRLGLEPRGFQLVVEHPHYSHADPPLLNENKAGTDCGSWRVECVLDVEVNHRCPLAASHHMATLKHTNVCSYPRVSAQTMSALTRERAGRHTPVQALPR